MFAEHSPKEETSILAVLNRSPARFIALNEILKDQARQKKTASAELIDKLAVCSLREMNPFVQVIDRIDQKTLLKRIHDSLEIAYKKGMDEKTYEEQTQLALTIKASAEKLQIPPMDLLARLEREVYSDALALGNEDSAKEQELLRSPDVFVQMAARVRDAYKRMMKSMGLEAADQADVGIAMFIVPQQRDKNLMKDMESNIRHANKIMREACEDGFVFSSTFNTALLITSEQVKEFRDTHETFEGRLVELRGKGVSDSYLYIDSKEKDKLIVSPVYLDELSIMDPKTGRRAIVFDATVRMILTKEICAMKRMSPFETAHMLADTVMDAEKEHKNILGR